MMSMALITKCVIGNLSKKAKARLYIIYKLLIYFRRHFNSYTLVTTQSASIFKNKSGHWLQRNNANYTEHHFEWQLAVT